VTAGKWWSSRLVGFDTETDGVNPLEARIVTAAVVHVQPGQRPSILEWILDPGREIPADASAVHGWTRDKVLEQTGGPGLTLRITSDSRIPMTTDGALGEIAGHLAVAMHAEAAVVAANAAFDLSLLECELARNGIDTLSVRPSGIRGLVDPMVLDRAFDPYRKVKGGCRKGKYDCGGCGATDKTLGSLCAHYGVRLPGAHRASVDAVAACRLAVKLMTLWQDTARLKLATLHAHQVTWRREQADSLRAYFDKAGSEHDGVDGGWPLHSSLQLAGVAS